MATGRIGTTPVLQVRWSKAPSAGTTSLSGLDDNSVSLVYSVGYEAVYRNGVLLSRTNDYTATDGTTITLIDATIAGDIIEVFANQTIPLADTYSQTVANGKFINNTLTTTTGDIIYASAANTPARLGIGSTDQVLKVSGGVPVWATPASTPDFKGFSAYLNTAQTPTASTYTKLAFSAENFDTEGWFDTSLYRFTPTTAGYYKIDIMVMANSTARCLILLYKNGAALTRVFDQQPAASLQGTYSAPFYSNGTDYWEVYIFQAATSSAMQLGLDLSVFSATYLGV